MFDVKVSETKIQTVSGSAVWLIIASLVFDADRLFVKLRFPSVRPAVKNVTNMKILEFIELSE